MTARLHGLIFPGALVERGFWLYVWVAVTAEGAELLYVGRTGDSSSVNAQSPYIRMGQHLGSNESTNMLRTHLEKLGVSPISCKSFELVSYGPILPEGKNKAEHYSRRDKIAALEKKLSDSLHEAGYAVLNCVNCRKELDPELWREVRAAFAERFTRLCESAEAAATGEL